MFKYVTDYLKGLFQENTAVGTIAHGVSNDIDITKKNLYPLVYIQWVNFNLDGNQLEYTFEVHVLSMRDITKVVTNDRWARNENELDNYALTSDIAIKFITSLRNRNNDIDVNGEVNTLELVSHTSPEAITLEFMNMLDGVKFQVTVAVNNIIGGC